MRKSAIKIIKKKDVSKTTEKVETTKKHSSETAKEMVSNVSSWVNDFQLRKREETKKGFETLFSNGQRNVES